MGLSREARNIAQEKMANFYSSVKFVDFRVFVSVFVFASRRVVFFSLRHLCQGPPMPEWPPTSLLLPNAHHHAGMVAVNLALFLGSGGD